MLESQEVAQLFLMRRATLLALFESYLAAEPRDGKAAVAATREGGHGHGHGQGQGQGGGHRAAQHLRQSALLNDAFSARGHVSVRRCVDMATDFGECEGRWGSTVALLPDGS